MKSSTTPDFWRAYANLPADVKARARMVFRLWKHDPRHASLRFKKVGRVWTIRIGAGYRALALLDGESFFWIWIGNHDEYERLLGEEQGR